MSGNRCVHEFYLVWESSCRNFMDEISFSCEEAKSSVRLHIFLRKDTPSKALPPSYSWIEKHYSLTTSPYASNTELIACLLRKYGNFKDFEDKEIPRTQVYLVAEWEREYEELIAILKTYNSVVNFQEINGIEKDIVEVLNSSCYFCRLLFANAEETETHNLEKHDYFCDNSSCYRHLQRFRCKETLAKHKASRSYCPNCNKSFCSEEVKRVHMASEHGVLVQDHQTETTVSAQSELKIRISCQFCPQRKFFSWDQREIHMKLSHKKCNCSCEQYFATREDYLQHFYSVYPLPCYENRKCPHRFQSVYYQASHHMDFHNAQNPFYCVPCHNRKVENNLESGIKTYFKDDKSLRIHGASLGHNETEMFLIDFDESEDGSAVQRKSPTRTCSNMNYF